MQPGAAPWWNDPKAKDAPVVAHTPDESRYHYPDERQSERMRSGVSLGVVIPRANDDGTSKGFDGRVAGVVHVDPDAPDGGAVVDLTRLDPNAYYSAFQQSSYPHEVFYRMGVSPSNYGLQSGGQRRPEPRPVNRNNHMVPEGSYVVPKASEDGTQVADVYNPPGQEEPMHPVPPLPPLQPQHTPAPQLQPMQPQPASAYPAPAQPVPAFAPPQQPVYQQPQQPAYQQPQPQQPVYQQPQQDMSQLYAMVGQLTNVVNGLAQQVQQRPVPPLAPQPQLQTMPDPVPYGRARPITQPAPKLQRMPARQPDEGDGEDEYQPKQTLRQIELEAEEGIREGVIVGFETLEMSFINGPKPEKPRRQVVFSMPGIGAMATRYHDVVDGGDCIALVYDTRYEDGQQFLPPDLGEQRISITVKKTKKTYVCGSIGIHFNVGVLDIVVLPKKGDDEDEVDDVVDDDE